MYNRRRLITSGVAGILGMSLASLGIKQAHAETPNETSLGSLVFIGDGGPELIRLTKDEPVSVFDPENVDWIGADGTAFSMYRFNYIISDDRHYILKANVPGLPYHYRQYPKWFVDAYTKEGYANRLEALREDFEYWYYNEWSIHAQ